MKNLKLCSNLIQPSQRLISLQVYFITLLVWAIVILIMRIKLGHDNSQPALNLYF